MRLSIFGIFGLKFMDILLLIEDTEADQNLMRDCLDNRIKVDNDFMALENEVE